MFYQLLMRCLPVNEMIELVLACQHLNSGKQLATDWTAEGSNFESRRGEIFSSPRHADRFWGSSSTEPHIQLVSGVKHTEPEAVNL
jgi:hypothetical protein